MSEHVDLRPLDAIEAPDLWPEIVGRASWGAREVLPAASSRWAAVVVALAIAAGGVATAIVSFPSGPRTPLAAPTPGPTSKPTPGQAAPVAMFVPPATRDGDRTRMSVTFPHGETAEISYPAELALEGSSIQAFHASSDGCASDITLVQDASRFRRGVRPLRLVSDAGGRNAFVWRGERGVRFRAHVLGGRWTALMHAASEREAAACASALRVDESSGGWPILDIAEGARLWGPDEDGPGKPQVAFIGVTGRQERWILLISGSCEAKGEIVRTFASWCDPEASMTVHVYSDGPRFIEQVRRGLRIHAP